MPTHSRTSTRACTRAREGNCIVGIFRVHKKGRRRHSWPPSRAHARAWLNVPRACTRGAQQFLESIKRGRNQNFLTHRGRARGRADFLESVKRRGDALSCRYSRRHRARVCAHARGVFSLHKKGRRGHSFPTSRARASHFETHRAGACARGRARVGAFMSDIACAREGHLGPHDECDRYRARARGAGHE